MKFGTSITLFSWRNGRLKIVLADSAPPAPIGLSPRKKMSKNFQCVHSNSVHEIRRAGSATESLHKKYGLFEKEILMYGTVVPELDEMLRKSQKTETQKYDLSEMFPKFYGAGFINQDLFLFFEDIVSDSKSFVTGDKDFHSKEQAGLAEETVSSYTH